jgi:hypothetical protein
MQHRRLLGEKNEVGKREVEEERRRISGRR